jgi:hypothetical protein
MNSNSAFFKSQFSEFPEVKSYLISNLEKMKNLEETMPSRDGQFLVELKAFVKRDFIAHLQTGDTTGHLCSCKALFDRNFFKSGAQAMVVQECQRLCSGNALEFDEDEALEFDEDY